MSKQLERAENGNWFSHDDFHFYADDGAVLLAGAA
jgi:hypothetical protein